MFDRKVRGNETIPQKCVNAIAFAIAEHRPAIFHAGCNSCVWRHMNTTHQGITFCRGCSYFAFNQSLPDKRREADRTC